LNAVAADDLTELYEKTGFSKHIFALDALLNK